MSHAFIEITTTEYSRLTDEIARLRETQWELAHALGYIYSHIKAGTKLYDDVIEGFVTTAAFDEVDIKVMADALALVKGISK